MYRATAKERPPTGSPSCFSAVAVVAASTRHGVKNATAPGAAAFDGNARIAPTHPRETFPAAVVAADAVLSPVYFSVSGHNNSSQFRKTNSQQ